MQDMTFEQWRRQVDCEVGRLCGLGSDDLPDVDYWRSYESGDTPGQAARYAILAAQDREDEYDEEMPDCDLFG